MAKKEFTYNYNLKTKKDDKSLVVIIGYYNGKWSISTTQNVYVKTWNVVTQRCE